ncbi:acyl-CoA synthetase [Mangrovimicrobium sediminis]|uniref:Acyl-CoA synthetase n=1 Tax=Mangrovimicrobium sediminis TaxID=2562682 RepID=A0A4Z0LZG4_9GAMM|nr:AMP-binding protein [Haliea sp. SAOS-164]TGD72659.1 acyl-CoA synthetase [Haliea sp. SAOS-164]
MTESADDSLPLLSRRDDTPFAVLLSPTAALARQAPVVSTARFRRHVLALAEQLPAGEFAINLCDSRYLFCVAFCAALLRGHTNLLPPNRAAQTLATLERRHSCYYLVDGEVVDTQLPVLDLAGFEFPDGEAPAQALDIPGDHIAAECYTSGSTGESKPIPKRWSQLARANAVNGQRMLEDGGELVFQLATVPPQHMWGLETSVMLPLHHELTMTDTRPFYPADIVAQLQRLPTPRMLVSSPIHLRALLAHDPQTPLPQLQRVLCATAPLGQALAADVEARTGARLVEIYGCSELGSMASRATSETEVWSLFPGFSMWHDEGGATLARAPHIEEVAHLGDHLELLDESHFRLAGRTEDLLNIAGKRASLAEINRVLLEFDGIVDGVVFAPPQRAEQRLAALVVFRPGVDKSALLAHFRGRIDPAFIPRPIVDVPGLPRADSGKLPKEAVLALYAGRGRQAS